MTRFRASASSGRRIALFRALATLVEGGTTVDSACARLAPLFPDAFSPGSGPAGTRLAGWLTRDRDGASELAAVEASEHVGDLGRTLRQLADDLEARLAARREAQLLMAYPILVLHLVAPAASMGDLLRAPGRFAVTVIGATALLWGILGGIVWLHRCLANSPAGARWLARIPVVGTPFVLAARARWLRLFATLHGAGVKAIEALATCERTLGSAPPSGEYAEATAAARRGAPLEDAIAQLSGMSTEERAQLVVAAGVGDLERAARRVADGVAEQWREANRRLARTAGATTYAVAVIVVTITLVNYYAGYYGALTGGRR